MIMEIESFISTGNEKYEDFIKNRMLCSATERCFGIIDEATNRIKRTNPELKIKHNKEVIELINLDYKNITPEMVWAITQKDIPVLKTEVQQLISSLNN